MSLATAACPNCRTILPGAACNRPGEEPCPGCHRPIHVEVFPALFRRTVAGRSAEPILEAGVSACYYHDGKKAVVPCDGCGRFLCALCEVDLNGQHLCPNCIDTGRLKGSLAPLETERTVYDSMALSLTTWPLLIWPFTILTAPTAFIVALLSFRRPTSLVRQNRARSFVAIVLSLLQMGAWTWALFMALF